VIRGSFGANLAKFVTSIPRRIAANIDELPKLCTNKKAPTHTTGPEPYSYYYPFFGYGRLAAGVGRILVSNVTLFLSDKLLFAKRGAADRGQA
jgi:hypothetical protein